MTDDPSIPQVHVRPLLMKYRDQPREDDALAVRIREDGRRLIEGGAQLDLQEYLEALPGIEHRRLAFDAAIDVVLKSNSRTRKPDASAVESLVCRFPRHERAIRDAAAISGALWSTHATPAGDRERRERTLPCGFGPALHDGEPRYRLIELLDSGASADVYRAEDRHLSEPDRPAVVAIKVFASSPDAPHRTAEEAARARSINHPNVVKIYDYDVSPEGESYIVQEFVDGGNLHDWADRHVDRARAREAATLLLSVARGLQAIHSRGLVHLDLKPANILLTTDGVPKITDFGLASREETASPAGGDACGTAGFMSPEQFFGELGSKAPQADVYSLGGVLHWMTTGELPNGEHLDTIAETHRSGRVRDDALRRACREKRIDQDLVAICARALEPALSDRYQSAAELAQDLESWITREPIRWTNPGLMKQLRLFAVRHPALTTMTVLLGAAIVAIGVAVEVARHYSTVARTEALEARANAALLEAERAWKQRSAENLQQYLLAMYEAQEAGLAGEVLTALWMLEWVQGPTLLNKQADLPKLWEARMETFEGLLAERRAEGGEDSFDALQYEALLAFWHLQNDDYREAEPLIDHSLSEWRERLDEDDPWLHDLEVIKFCAEVDRHLDEHDASELVGPPRARALRLERLLKSNYDRLAGPDDGAQLRLLILTRLQRLYAPSALANGAWLEWAEDQEAHLGLSD